VTGDRRGSSGVVGEDGKGDIRLDCLTLGGRGPASRVAIRPRHPSYSKTHSIVAAPAPSFGLASTPSLYSDRLPVFPTP
jgi:hypothetical protein